MTNTRPIRTMIAAAAMLGAVGGVAALPLTPAPAAAAESDTIGPAVGRRLLLGNGHVRDEHGNATTLARVADGKPMMMVMFRSAAWCPYCQAQLMGLGPVAEAAKTKGIRFIAMSYDDPETLAKFAAKQDIAFPMYSDPDSRIVKSLGLRDPQYPEDSIAYGVPYPTVLLLGPQGRVKAKSVETNYKVRPSQADLIAMMDKLRG